MSKKRHSLILQKTHKGVGYQNVRPTFPQFQNGHHVRIPGYLIRQLPYAFRSRGARPIKPELPSLKSIQQPPPQRLFLPLIPRLLRPTTLVFRLLQQTNHGILVDDFYSTLHNA